MLKTTKTHKFDTGPESSFLIWFLQDGAIEVRTGEQRVCMLAHGYATAHIPELEFWQSADCLFVGHECYEPMVLMRLTDRDWEWKLVKDSGLPPIYEAPHWLASRGYGIPTPPEKLAKVDLAKMATGGPMTAVDKQSVLWRAWEQYQQSEDYANSVKWAADPQHLEGSLWNLFSVGFLAATQIERDRCVAILNEARGGEADTDLRSIRSRIETGYRVKE